MTHITMQRNAEKAAWDRAAEAEEAEWILAEAAADAATLEAQAAAEAAEHAEAEAIVDADDALLAELDL